MEKQTIENLKQTIDDRISETYNIANLRDVNNELIEWINWLSKSKKISKIHFSELRNLISLKMNEKEMSFAEKDNVPSYHGTLNKYVLATFLIFFALVLIWAGFYFIYRPTQYIEESQSLGTIPFRGTLKDAEGQPIDSKTDVIFRLYNQQSSEIPLYEGKCIGTEGIVPDYKGEFTIILGADCLMDPIPEELFLNDVLFLGVTIATGEEISPRYRILSSTYSHNSAQVDGKTVGTGSNSIPYLDENATILIEADSPYLKATNGELTIEGASLSLKTISGGGGNIIIQPDAGGYTGIPSGNFGLGVFEPNSKLDVAGMEPYNPIANIKNISIEDLEDTNVLSLGLGTSGEGEYSKFISFRSDVTKDEEGTEVGSIRLNKDAVAYETKGADFAEYFYSPSAVQTSPGIIISLSDRGVAVAKENEIVIGVVSDTAGFIGNAQPEKSQSILVGLTGQISVYVTNENGWIRTGDSIGVGTVPGYGVLGQSTSRVGYALEHMSEDRMDSNLCPVEFRQIKDQLGNPIKCARLKVLLRPK